MAATKIALVQNIDAERTPANTLASSEGRARLLSGVAVLAGLVLGALALRLFRLGHQSLWSDEIFSFLSSRQGFRAILTHPSDPHFELYQLALHAVSLFSTHEWWLRLPSVCCGVLSVALFFSIVKAWCGRKAGWVAATLLAVSPYHVWYSQEARSYAMLLFLALLSFWLLQQTINRERRLLPKLGFVVVTAALLYAHPMALAFIGFLFVYALWQTPRQRWAGWLPVFGVIALLIAPAVYQLLVSPPNNSVPSYRPFNPADVAYALWVFVAGFSLGPSVAELQMPHRVRTLTAYLPLIGTVALLAGALWLAGAVRLWREQRAVFWTNALWFAAPMAFAIAGAIGTGQPFNARYVILALPAFLTFLALGALGLPRGWMRAGAIGLLLLISLISLRNYYYDERYQREDNRAAGQFLAAHAAPGDLVIACAHYTAEDLRYYSQREDLRLIGYSAVPDGAGPALNPGAARATIGSSVFVASSLPSAVATPRGDSLVADDLRRIIGDRPHVWVFLSRVYHGDPAGHLRRFFQEHFRADLRFQSTGVEVIRYEQR